MGRGNNKPGFVASKIECQQAGTLHIKRKLVFIVVKLFIVGLCFSSVAVKVVLEPCRTPNTDKLLWNQTSETERSLKIETKELLWNHTLKT
jgi:hypothetical protein